MNLKEKIWNENRYFYDSIVDFHDRANSYIAKKDRQNFYERLFLQIIGDYGISLRGARTLELGCGSGNFISFLFSQQINNYVGVDVSEKMIREAQRKSFLIEKSSKTELFSYPAEDFIEQAKSGKRQFDVIFSFSFLHHLFDPQKFLIEIGDIIAPGGIYLALHETNQGARTIFGMKIDTFAAYLMGYDTVDFPLSLRLKRILKNITQKVIKRIVPHRESNRKPPDYVEYQLNHQKFSPESFTGGLGNVDVEIKLALYTYYVYRFSERLFGEADNYFYLVARKK